MAFQLSPFLTALDQVGSVRGYMLAVTARRWRGTRSPASWGLAQTRAEQAGLEVVDLRTADLKMEFFDVGAMVYFLRKVIWFVPDFTVGKYRDRLEALHEQIGAEGAFTACSRRFLIEARKPERRSR